MIKSVHERAFLYLLNKKENRKSENAKGRLLQYNEFSMADYLNPNEEHISIEEQKWLFKCKVEDMDIKGNNRCKYQDISCSSCQRNVDETQYHILNCKFLMGKNENLTYLPEYEERYNGDIKEQLYVSKLLKENFNRRVLYN